MVNQDGKMKALSRFSIFHQQFALILVCIALYGNTILNDYSFDDNIAVTENPFVQKGIKGIPDLLTSPYRTIGDLKMEYRPLSGITLALEQQLFGGNPHVSHAVNVVLFALLACLIFLVLGEAFGLDKLHWALPFLITLFYVVHPSNTETVASIKNREQIFSMMFALLSVLYSIRMFFRQNRKIYNGAAAIVMMALSYLSKMVLSIPVLVVVFLLWLFKSDRKLNRNSIILFTLFILLTAGFAVANASISMRPSSFIENPLASNPDMLARIGFMFKTLLFYFKFMLVPYPFRFYYGYDMIPLSPLNPLVVLLSVLIHGAWLVSSVILFMRRRISGLLMLGYLANISFYSNLYPVPGIVSERTLFIAALWFIAALVSLLFEAGVFRKGNAPYLKKVVTAAGLTLLLVYGGMIIHRNFQWKNQGVLMASDIGHLERSALANYIYAKYLLFESEKAHADDRNNLLSGSKKHFRQVIKVYPEYFDPYFRLGMIYEYKEQNRDSAFLYFRQAYKRQPLHNQVRFQLGKQYFLAGNYPEANKLFEAVHRDIPTDTSTLFFYGLSLLNAGAVGEALMVTEELKNLAPSTFYPYYNYGMIYKYLGDMDNAVVNFEKTIQFGYSDDEIKNVLYDHYASKGMFKEAERLRGSIN